MPLRFYSNLEQSSAQGFYVFTLSVWIGKLWDNMRCQKIGLKFTVRRKKIKLKAKKELASTSSHWSRSSSISLCMGLASDLGIFSSSLCRSSTVLMSWSMSSCFSLSSALTASCLTGQKERSVNESPLEGVMPRKLEIVAVAVSATAYKRGADNVN